MQKQIKLLDLEALGIEQNEDEEYQMKGKKTLKADDLGKVGSILDAAILDFETLTFEDGSKVILTLNIPALGNKEEKRIRRLTLNKTNLVTLLNAFGVDGDKWINKMIELRVESTLFQGKKVPAIRVYVK